MAKSVALSRADSTRQRLLDAAVEAFAAKGFHGTATRDIAAAAGMSPAVLYVHYKSKEELLYRISLQGHRHTLELIERAVAGAESPVDQLARLVQLFAVDHASSHKVARIVNYELAALGAEHLETIRSLRRQTEQAVRDVVAEGVKQGEFVVEDVRIAAIAILSLGIDVARWYRDSGEWTPGDIGSQYSALALRLVGAQARPQASG